MRDVLLKVADKAGEKCFNLALKVILVSRVFSEIDLFKIGLTKLWITQHFLKIQIYFYTNGCYKKMEKQHSVNICIKL